MSLKLSIVIPYKHETIDQLAKCLSSINGQVGIYFTDLEVLLMGDGGNHVENSDFAWCDRLSLRIYNYKRSAGTGTMRQRGINYSHGEYVMFIDADDELRDVNALHRFFDAIEQTGDHQLLIAGYDEVTGIGLGAQINTHLTDWKAPYGKWFQRSYLDELQLTWPKKLLVYEDVYFVGLACMLATDIYPIKASVYTWTYNPNSIVHRDHQAYKHQLDQWMRSNRLLLAFLIKKDADQAGIEFAGLMADLYFRERMYQADNPRAYREELVSLFREQSDLWLSERKSVMEIATDMSEQAGRYEGQSLDELPTFVGRMDRLWRQNRRGGQHDKVH